MSTPAVIYDLSRLATRILNRTPNGIDRLDVLLADHFLVHQQGLPLLFGAAGPRIVANTVGLETIGAVRRLWGETDPVENDDILRAICEALSRRRDGPSQLSFRTGWTDRARRGVAAASALARRGLVGGRDPTENAPRDAIFFNTTHFPIEWQRHVAWLDRRPDVRPVLFVHDVLPVSRPKLFWRGEAQKHARRLRFLAKRGAAAIVTSEIVEEELRRVLRSAGRNDLPIFRAAPPVPDIFFESSALPEGSLRTPYSVICGTIEPRKNHLLIAQVWRRLVQRFGQTAPKLLVVGKRGWSTQAIVEALHAPDLRGHIIEASGVPSTVYRALLGNAVALLAPSLDEGFGLTLAEALTAGVPAIASDIQAHREQAGSHALLLDHSRQEDWFDAIVAYAQPGSRERRYAVDRLSSYRPVSRARYLDGLDAFFVGL